MAAFVASAGSFGLSITTTPTPSSSCPSPDPYSETGSRASLAYSTSVVSSTVAISSGMCSHSQVLSACKCLSSSPSGALNASKALLGSTSTCGYGRGGCLKIVARAGGSSAKHPEITSQPPSEDDSARDRLAVNKEKMADTVMLLGEDEKLDQEKDKDIDNSEAKSDEYSSTMTHAMGAVLTYRHELGMNYNFVLPDLIVGSCLQTPSDVDHLKNIGVKTIFCLQQDPDLEYFGVDINAIQEHAKVIGGIEHIRAQIRDFDPFDLRKQLPSVVAILYEAIERNKGITYIHCTAGMGRAPAVALTYMHWMLGYELLKANELLLSVRPCFPKLESIRNATCDLLTGGARETIHLRWPVNDCETVEISGLDVGWGQMLPLTFIPMENYWMLSRELLVGKYEYKYIVDGMWTTNPHEPLTQPNKDGHVNNFVEVVGEFEDKDTKALRQRLMQDNPILNEIDRQIIRRKLMSLVSC